MSKTKPSAAHFQHLVMGISDLPVSRRRAFLSHISALIIFVAVTATTGCRKASQPDAQPVLTTVGQIHDLAHEDADLGHPVRLRGVATYVYPSSKALIVQDQTGGVYVDTSRASIRAKAGQEIEVEGVTGCRELSNIIIISGFTSPNAISLPDARQVSLKDMASGKYSYLWVEAEGIVRSGAVQNDGELSLDIAADGGKFRARIAESDRLDFNSLTDSKVKVQGVSCTIFNSKREAVRLQLLVPDIKNVIVKDSGPGDPFSIPVQSIGSLSSLTSQASSGHRVHVQGVVTSQTGSDLSVKDETGELHVGTEQVTLVQPGSHVDVFGFPLLERSRVFLDDAIFQETDARAPAADANNQTEPSSPLQRRLPVLEAVSQVHKLTPGEAKRSYPVYLRAVVTYYDPFWHYVFVQDSTGGIFISVENIDRELEFEPSQLVEVHGQSGAGDFAPVVVRPRFRILGTTSMPIAPHLSLDELFSGRQDGNWVDAQGIVQTVSRIRQHVSIDIVSGSHKFGVLVPGFRDREIPTYLVDARITVRGACATFFNEKRQLVGIQIRVPAMDYISVEEPGPGDPYSMPVRPINSIMRYSPGESAGHRIRVQGIVMFQRVGGFVVIKDETSGVYVQTRQDTKVEPGDRIEVVGFAAAGEYTPILQDATFRKISSGPAPVPVFITAEEALGGNYNFQLVEIEAFLLDRVATSAGLTLQAGGETFNAFLENGVSKTLLPCATATSSG